MRCAVCGQFKGQCDLYVYDGPNQVQPVRKPDHFDPAIPASRVGALADGFRHRRAANCEAWYEAAYSDGLSAAADELDSLLREYEGGAS